MIASPICGQCGRPWLDHTLREAREHHPAQDLNLPLERLDPAQPSGLTLGDLGEISGACVVRATAVEGLDGRYPALAFSFKAPDGLSDAANVVIVLDETKMLALAQLVTNAVGAAIAASRRS